MDCIFCQIAAGEMGETIYADDQVVAFHDINPQAPVHVLIIPKAHIPTLNDCDATHTALMGHILMVAKQLAAELGIAESGYRTNINCNAGGGQEVFHLHCHLLGGRQMTWPPG